MKDQWEVGCAYGGMLVGVSFGLMFFIGLLFG